MPTTVLHQGRRHRTMGLFLMGPAQNSTVGMSGCVRATPLLPAAGSCLVAATPAPRGCHPRRPPLCLLTAATTHHPHHRSIIGSSFPPWEEPRRRWLARWRLEKGDRRGKRFHICGLRRKRKENSGNRAPKSKEFACPEFNFLKAYELSVMF